LPLLALRTTNADLLGLRMAWPVYSVPLTVVGCIAVVVGVAVVIFRPKGGTPGSQSARRKA
jgi:hypothetical protein